MKNTTKRTLALRAYSIRNLTAGELRVANGGQKRPLPPTRGCTAQPTAQR